MKKLPIIALLALLCGSCVPPPAIPDGDSPIHANNPLNGMAPTIQAWSDGKPLLLGVDTGATQPAVFFSPAVKNLHGSLRGKAPMQWTKLPISLTKNGTPLEEKTEVANVSSAPYDGLLGWGTIQQFVWHLNLPKQHHDFYVSLPKPVKRWKKIGIVPNPHYLQLSHPASKLALIDTGAPHTIYIGRHKWEKFKADYPDAFVSIYSGYSPAAGGYYAYECMHIESFSIGSLKMNNVLACESFVDKNLLGISEDIDIMLGLDAFKEHSFWISPRDNAVFFRRVDGVKTSPPNYNLVGATFIPSPDGRLPLTAKVAPLSPAWYAGLRSGDTIVAINGRLNPTDSMIDYVTTQEGVNASVAFRRKGQIYTVTWTVPARPPAGEYHPTPVAVTQQEYERLQELESISSSQPASPYQTNTGTIPATPANPEIRQ